MASQFHPMGRCHGNTTHAIISRLGALPLSEKKNPGLALIF
jgi:hypothetical protein